MKWLILFIPIHLAFAEKAPDCNGLTRIVEHYETSLLGTSLKGPVVGGKNKSCSELVASDFFQTPDGENPVVSETFKSHRCSTLADIEASLAQLENEQAALMGFAKMISDIQTNHAQLKAASETRTPAAQIRRAGLDFADGVITAQSLESLLQSQDKSNVNFLLTLKSLPESERDTPEKLRIKINQLCRERTEISSLRDACHESFKPTEAAMGAIQELITHSRVTPEEINQWKEAMVIKKSDDEDDDYSFNSLHDDITRAGRQILDRQRLEKIRNGELIMDRETLKAMKSIPSFDSVAGLKYLDLKKKIPDSVRAHDFKFHLEDLGRRQEFELRSKLSLASLSLGDDLPSECESIRISGDLRSCHDKLKARVDALPGASNKKSDSDRLLGQIKVGIDYQTKISQFSTQCLSDLNRIIDIQTRSIGGDCNLQKFLGHGTTNEHLESVGKKILALNMLKEKIGEQESTNLAVRNFAVDKLASMPNCISKSESQLSCEQGSTIAPEANYLASEFLKVGILKINKPANDIKALCEDKNIKFFKKEQLCAFNMAPNPNDNVIDPKVKPETYMAPVDGPDTGYNPTREGFINGLGIVANQLASSLAPKPNFNHNPFQYNYAPYQFNGPGLMSTSDQILFNARYYGAYGFYMPTQGYQPFTAFGTSSFGSYGPYASTSRSSYFGGR
jgi:hypothetical protein